MNCVYTSGGSAADDEDGAVILRTGISGCALNWHDGMCTKLAQWDVH